MSIETGQQPAYLSPEDVATRLQVHVQTVRAWIRSGHMQASNVSPGARPTWRIAAAELDRWTEARKR